MGASTTRGEPPSYHGRMHIHGTLQHPVHASRRLLRPLGTTQKHPIGQWSLLLVRCAPVRCALYTEDNSRNSPLVYLLAVCIQQDKLLIHDIGYTNTPPQWKVHPRRTHATLTCTQWLTEEMHSFKEVTGNPIPRTTLQLKAM